MFEWCETTTLAAIATLKRVTQKMIGTRKRIRVEKRHAQPLSNVLYIVVLHVSTFAQLPNAWGWQLWALLIHFHPFIGYKSTRIHLTKVILSIVNRNTWMRANFDYDGDLSVAMEVIRNTPTRSMGKNTMKMRK